MKINRGKNTKCCCTGGHSLGFIRDGTATTLAERRAAHKTVIVFISLRSRRSKT